MPYSFGLKILPDIHHLCIEFWLRFEPQIRPTRFSINFLFIIARVERKVRLCVKLFDFFPRWILIRLSWNLSRFLPNSVQILTWNFMKKLFQGPFFWNFLKNQGSSSKICEILPYFLQFYFVLKSWVKKFTQVLPCVVCTLRRRHVYKQITKRRYREEKPGHFVFEKPVLFILCLGLTTPYSLGLLIWKFYQTFFILCIEFWLRFELQIRPTRFSINLLFITVRVERKVRLCVKLFHFFPGWILTRFTWNLSRFVPNSVEIPTRNFRKKPLRENFSEILCKPKLSLTTFFNWKIWNTRWTCVVFGNCSL